MYISEAKTLIRNSILKNVHVSFLFIGTMGIGKSQMMQQVADELNYRLIDLRLAQQEPGDLIGVPRSDERTNRTVWRKPEWWPDPGEKCIIHLDELNRAPTDVRQAVFQLVLDKRLHTHVLDPNNAYVHASINPDIGAYQVEQLDQAMIRRFCNVKIVPNVEEFTTYWHHRYPEDRHADLISRFILAHEKLLCFQEEFQIECKPTPDGYRMVYELMSNQVVPSNLEHEVYGGLIGMEAATSFIRFMDKEYVKPVSGKDILNNYGNVKTAVEKQANDAMYVTIHDLLSLLKAQDKELPKRQLENLEKYLLDSNEETKSTFISNLPTTGFILRQLSDNKELVVACRKFIRPLNG